MQESYGEFSSVAGAHVTDVLEVIQSGFLVNYKFPSMMVQPVWPTTRGHSIIATLRIICYQEQKLKGLYEPTLEFCLCRVSCGDLLTNTHAARRSCVFKCRREDLYVHTKVCECRLSGCQLQFVYVEPRVRMLLARSRACVL